MTEIALPYNTANAEMTRAEMTRAKPVDPKKLHLGNAMLAGMAVAVDLSVERIITQPAIGLAAGETADPKTHLSPAQELQAATNHLTEHAQEGHVITMTPPTVKPFTGSH